MLGGNLYGEVGERGANVWYIVSSLIRFAHLYAEDGVSIIILIL